jgi:hypothetical protein
MEFKQWLYTEKAVWRLSDIAKQGKMPNVRDRNSQNLGWRAIDGFMGGINDIQREKLWGNVGGPQHPSIRFPHPGNFVQAYQNAKKTYNGEAPEQQAHTNNIDWNEQIRAGEAIAHKQTLNGVGNNPDAAMQKAFETLLQNLRRTNPNYTYQMVQLIRKMGYAEFLNPARPTPDATGNLTFDFVIPKPENIF